MAEELWRSNLKGMSFPMFFESDSWEEEKQK
jgi:hypothetical protein